MELSGKYNCTMHTPIGERYIVLDVHVDDKGQITGTLDGEDHGCSAFQWGHVVDDKYLFFNTFPHDCDLTFFGVVDEDGNFYGANFHKGHSSLFTGKRA